MNKRASLVQAIHAAGTLSEQARAVTALDEFDRMQRQAAAEERSWDAAGAVVEQTLAPVRVHEFHTAATEWLADVDTTGGNYHQEMVAQASAWYSKVSEAVKADPEELAEQARGMARRTAGRYGEAFEPAAQTFLDYVAYLHKDAASGLDQIDQLRDPKDDPKPTPYPTEVFDTFEDEVHPINQGVSGTETSYRAPLIQEIEQAGGGSGAPERPNQHSTTEDETNSYSEVPEGQPGRLPTQASFHEGPSVAIGYTMNLNDWQRQQAEASRLDFKRREEAAAKEAASQLPQVQQEVDSFENPAPTPLPQDVMFPLVPGFGGQGDGTPQQQETKAQAKRREFVASLLTKNPLAWSPVERAEVWDYLSTTASLKKVSDQFTAPHEGPGSETPIANSADTTAPPPSGSRDKGFADGQADRAAGERPSFSDASSAASDYIQGYSQGYSSGSDAPTGQPDVPYSMGGDAGQQQNFGDSQQQAQVAQATKTATKKLALKTSAAFVTEGATDNADFKKGYGWAANWNPKKAMVRMGSQEFEAGVYAGITDNSGQQKAWVAEHRKAAKKHNAPELMRRISLHEKVTRRYARKNDDATVKGFYVQAATTTDLISDGPGTSPDPMGATPINGPGTPPPLEGGTAPAAPGGPSPYQGAPPYGSGPVAPDPVVGQQQPSQQTMPVTDSNVPNEQPQALAFRRLVQANLANMRENA